MFYLKVRLQQIITDDHHSYSEETVGKTSETSYIFSLFFVVKDGWEMCIKKRT